MFRVQSVEDNPVKTAKENLEAKSKDRPIKTAKGNSSRKSTESPVRTGEESLAIKGKESPVKIDKWILARKCKDSLVKTAKGSLERKSKESPVKTARGRPAKTGKGSPARKSKESTVKTTKASPARKSRESPVKTAKGSPARKSKENPVKTATGSPARKTKENLVKTAKGSLERKNKESPVNTAKGSPVMTTKRSPESKETRVEHDEDSPTKKFKRSQNHESPVMVAEGSPVMTAKGSPASKESLVEHGDDTWTKMLKRSQNHLSEISNKDTTTGKDESILPPEEIQESLDLSTGISTAFSVYREPPEDNEEPLDLSTRSRWNCFDFREPSTSKVGHSLLYSKETWVSQDLSTGTSGVSQDLSTLLSEAFSNWDGPSTSKADERDLSDAFSKLHVMSMSLGEDELLSFGFRQGSQHCLKDSSKSFPNLYTSDIYKSMTTEKNQTPDYLSLVILGNDYHSAEMNRTALSSEKTISSSKPIDQQTSESNPFRTKRFECMYCKKHFHVYPPMEKYKLECSRHGGAKVSQSKSYKKKLSETELKQLFSTKYKCFRCAAKFCDSRTFKCHLKCNHCLNHVTLCKRCMKLF